MQTLEERMIADMIEDCERWTKDMKDNVVPYIHLLLCPVISEMKWQDMQDAGCSFGKPALSTDSLTLTARALKGIIIEEDKTQKVAEAVRDIMENIVSAHGLQKALLHFAHMWISHTDLFLKLLWKDAVK